MSESEDLKSRDIKIARFSKAVSHPTRVAIVHFLANRDECCFNDIHKSLPLSKATVSQHLRELRDAGLVIAREETPKVFYRINSEAWDETRELFARFFDMCGCSRSRCRCGHDS